MKTIKHTSWNDLLYPGKATDFFRRRAFLPFDPDNLNYNQNSALWLAELSRLAYCDQTQTDDIVFPSNGWGRLWTARVVHIIAAETGTHAVLYKFNGTKPFAVLAFRGTEQNPKDFATDIEFCKVTIDDARDVGVHEGFLKAIDSVWPKILPHLEKLTCPVFYTGHSLGAALATLASDRHAPAALYTFGSPRVGNDNFAKWMRRVSFPIYRVVDDTDVITTVPPESFGYRHVGETKILGSFPRTFIEWCLDLFSPPKFLADHAPKNYVDRI